MLGEYAITRSRVAGLAVVFAAVLALSRAMAGEEKPTPVMLEEPAFVYDDAGRRDPFTFIKPIKIEKKEGPGVTPKEQSIQVKLEAERNYAIAANALMAGRARDALTACDKGLEAFKDTPVDDNPELQEIREKLFRLRKAAERQRNRSDAEDAFKNLNLRLAGVVARERDSKAIVNGKILGRGDLIEAADNSESAIVDDILPGRVVFRFRGYKIELQVRQ